ncbi:transcription factor bHLH18-like [Solanum pennellii]|uniref:Transcription factor bHLH18-like n=1 Tax=Solanum pennellii TaxID=28526 RepID=A0ABM1G3W1_SOLPN|nr:transcription factor bHLH18-like [Solanum pennellii]
MDISSATWWSEMDVMNMNELQYIDQTFDDFAFNSDLFTLDNIQVSQSGEIFEEKPAFCSSINQNTSTSPPCSSPSVISFSNSNSPSATPTTTNAQNYFKNLNTSSLKTEVPSGTTINFSSSNTCSDSDYDDSKQLFQAMGFGAGQSKKMNYSRTPLQAQDHVLAERKRRERLTQYFVTLSTLIPNLKKLDKASILGDAITYIKQLEEQVKRLDEEANKQPVKRSRLHSNYDNFSTCNENSNKSVVPEIDVRVSDGNVLIRVCCKKQAGIIKEIFSQVEMFQLTITSSSVIPFGYDTTLISIVAQMDHQLDMATEQVANNIRLSIMKLINSHK